MNGFAKGGVLIFDIRKIKKGESSLSVYVGFDLPRGSNVATWFFWRVFKWLFPGFVHNVLWNHALCKVKDIVETDTDSLRIAKPRPAPEESTKAKPSTPPVVRDKVTPPVKAPTRRGKPTPKLKKPERAKDKHLEDEKHHAIRFKDMVKLIQADLKKPSKKDKEKHSVIFALGTSWIPGYQEGEEIHNDLNPLVIAARKFAEARGMSFIVEDDDSLLAAIDDEKREEGKKNVKVIVLADENTIKSKEFRLLREDIKSVLVGVNNEQISAASYIRLIEMLTLTLQLAFEKYNGLIDTDIDIVSYEPNINNNVYIITPPARPIDYDGPLREVYQAQISA